MLIIPGANSGIGYDTSFVLTNDSPNNHIIMSARSAEKGKKALAEIQAREPAGTLNFLELDVTSDASINAAAQKLVADFGVIDVLVNNAGISVRDLISRENAPENLRYESLRSRFADPRPGATPKEVHGSSYQQCLLGSGFRRNET